MKSKSITVGLVGSCLLAASPLMAQTSSSIYAYPTAGQSVEQQQRDRFDCYQWAVSQTGYDPAAVPTLADQYPTPPVRSDRVARRRDEGPFGIGNGGIFAGSGTLGDAATGALLGAVGGAIAGDAGEGAAWGAFGGAVLGGLTRAGGGDADARRVPRRSQQEVEAEQRRLEAERLVLADEYRRAYSACLTGRGYTVR
jgi:hypothetical protein